MPWIEIGLFLILSYLPYVLSEGLGVSGILAIFMAAIFMRNYAFHSLSPIGQVTVESMIEMTCNVSENFVFAYMGLSIPITMDTIRFELIGIGTVALIVSRTVSVLFTSYLVNRFRTEKIPFSYQAIMSFSGLRGAVAFYLALNVQSEYKNLIITTTIGLIVVTIIGLGSTTTLLLKAMAKYFPEDGIFHSDDIEDMLLRREGRYSGMSESLYEKNFQDETGERRMSEARSIGVITRLEKIDQDYGKRFLRKDGWTDFLNEENQDKYNFAEYENSPDKGKYYDGLSNYQKSIARYLEESVVNLPYEDRKSIRLSMMSVRGKGRDDQGKSSYLHPNMKRQSVRRDPNQNMSRRMDEQRSYFKSTRKEQMSVMSEPRMGAPRGLKIAGNDQVFDHSRRLMVPNGNIVIGNLEDISSKGSHSESKGVSRQRSDDGSANPVEEDQSRIHSFKDPEESKEEVKQNNISKALSLDKNSKPRVTFSDQQIKIETLDASKEETKEDLSKSDNHDEKNDDKPDESGSGNAA